MVEYVVFYQGDKKRNFDPTIYRSEDWYSQLVTSVHMEENNTDQKFGFDIVLKKKVYAYVQVIGFSQIFNKINPK